MPWPGPHVTSLILTLLVPVPTDTQSSPAKNHISFSSISTVFNHVFRNQVSFYKGKIVTPNFCLVR